MFPPSSLICIVTTASPIHISAKTPEKTEVFCVADAVMDRSRLRSRQNMSGPLDDTSQYSAHQRTTGAFFTKDPNLVDPHSCHPAGQPPHLAIFQQFHGSHPPNYHLHPSLRLQCLPLSAASPQVDTLAIGLASSSPIRPINPEIRSPILTRR